MNIASFPWDPPPPAPAPAAVSAPAQAAAAPSAPIQQAGTPTYTSAQLSPPPNAQPLPSLANGLPGPSQPMNTHQLQPDANVKPEPQVKQEFAGNGMPPARPGNGPPQYGGPSSGPGALAAQRAVTQLQNQYGARAAASISAIQGFGQAGSGQPAAAPRPGGAPGQPPNQAQRPATQAQYSQQLANQTAAMAQSRPQQGNAAAPFPGQQRPGSSQQNGFQQSQVDGAGDEEAFEGVLLRRGENGETSELGRVDIDRMLHQQMAARAKQMEGGGLMLPLKQATKTKSVAKKSGPGGPSGFDGVDDDIKQEDANVEEDEDAINSDLDDPNEVDLEREDDDENIDQVMLCMYDKVQRVKNKWYVIMVLDYVDLMKVSAC